MISLNNPLVRIVAVQSDRRLNPPGCLRTAQQISPARCHAENAAFEHRPIARQQVRTVAFGARLAAVSAKAQ